MDRIWMVAIGSGVCAVIGIILIVTAIINPLMSGVEKAMDEGQYCVVEKTVEGTFARELVLEFDSVLYAKNLALYITPGGFETLQWHPERINVYVHDGTSWESIGDIRNLEEWDIDKEVSCMGLKMEGYESKDNCQPEQGFIWKIRAEAVMSDWCWASAALVCSTTLGAFWCNIGLIDRGELVSICNVKKISAKVYYPCSYESSLIEGNFTEDTVGVGWNHVYYLEEETDMANVLATDCSITNGEYSIQHLNKARQMTFPGLPLVQVGVRSGCVGVQGGGAISCDVRVYFAQPHDDDPGDCSMLNGVWQIQDIDRDTPGQNNFEHLDYEYIYSDALSLADYVNLNEKKSNFKKWCLRVNANSNCRINSIDVRRFVK